MIYLNEKSKDRLGFENLLLRTKDALLSKLKDIDNPSAISGNAFEVMTYDAAVVAAKGTEFEGSLEHTADAAFPDIVAAGYFGIEVKATKKDAWTSIGNSVLESSRVRSVRKIYMFFGKLGGEPDIVYRNYEECLKAIAVTHYPRYVIDMSLPEGKSIFDKMQVNYDEIRNSDNPVGHVRRYYKSRLKEGQALWWIDDDSDKSPALSPIIKSFSSFEPSKRDKIKADIFVRFPEILSTSSNKFENVAAYLVSEHGVVSSSLRDHFTAGGQVDLKLNDSTIRVPKIISELSRLTPLIRRQLAIESLSSLANYWQREVDDSLSVEENWKLEIDKQSINSDFDAKPSELYEHTFKLLS